jgi:hypothetical protein
MASRQLRSDWYVDLVAQSACMTYRCVRAPERHHAADPTATYVADPVGYRVTSMDLHSIHASPVTRQPFWGSNHADDLN